MSNEEKKTGFWVSLSVLSLFMLSQTSFIVNPVLSNLAALYPDVPYYVITMVSTVISLISIPMAYIGGALAGQKVKFKTLTIIAIACVLIGGLAPYFYDGFYFLFATRIVVGAGLGLSQPFGNALVIALFKGKKQEDMSGYGMIFQNISGVIFNIASGYLAVFNLKYVWLLHLVQVIPLILVVLFLPEPEKQTAEKVQKTSIKVWQLPLGVHIEGFMYSFFLLVLMYPYLLNTSSVITGEGIGTTALAGTINSAYTVGGLISGFTFAFLFRKLKKFTIPAALLCEGLALAVMAYTKTPIAFIIASAVIGFMKFTQWPNIFLDFNKYLGETNKLEAAGLASGMFFVWLNVGAFFCSFWIGLLAKITGNNNPRLPMRVGCVGLVICAVIWGLLILLNKIHPAMPEESQK